MAHLYIVTRGIKHLADEFIKQLSCKYLPMKIYKGDVDGINEDGDYQVQVAVRPIQLWEIVYPKEHQDLMLNTLLDGTQGGTNHKKHQKFASMMRKILGINKIPKYKTDKKLPISNASVDITAIGVKDDYTMPNGTEGL